MTQQTTQFAFGESYLTAGIALAIARKETQGIITDQVREKCRLNREIVERIAAKDQPVYGINTGFGPFCTTQISPEETKLLQLNILKSHSVGVGESIEEELAKLMLILKLQSLAKGHSGIAVSTMERILWHIDQDVIPVVPSKGSVGASGDLAPLSHLFLPLIGLGKVQFEGKTQDASVVLEKMGLAPIDLGPKEGLALINGTQFIAAHAVKVVEKLHSCLSQADIIGALMLEGLQGSAKPFFDELHQLRPYKGNIHVATRIRSLLKDSQINAEHANCERVQDPYSLRCMPQVHGASRNAWLHLKELLEVELNSVTDNPIIISDELTISGGSFHGQPLAMALDYACLAASEIGNISDRRIYLALEGKFGVPKLLMEEEISGLNSGYMILQYTTAALASENKGLCFPSSADSIPTSLGQEDHVSMGSIGGRKALNVLGNIEKILAIEMLVAAQAFDFREFKSGVILNHVYQAIRNKVATAKEDRVFAHDIETAIEMVQDQEVLKLANQLVAEENLPLATQFEQYFESY